MNNKIYFFIEGLKEQRHKIIEAKRHIDKESDISGIPERIFTDYIDQIVDSYQPILSSLASHYSNLIYRARKCIGDQPFNNKKDLYNPKKSTGRAKSSGNTPILYASSSMQTCLSEIDVEPGDLVNVAHFDYSDIMNGKFWFVGQLGSFFKSQDPSHYLSDENSVQNAFYVYPSEAKFSLVYLDNLINEIFAKLSSEDDDYILSRLLIEKIRKNEIEEKIFGVVFLSVKDAPGINFAIFDEAIDSLKLSGANLVRITDIDNYGNVGYKLLKNSKPENNSLTWPEDELDL